MNPETIAILVAAIALAGLILRLQHTTHRDIEALRTDMSGIRRDVADLRERMARLEGTVEVLTRFLVDREREGASGSRS